MPKLIAVALFIASIAVACAAPEPIIQEVEVTRVVRQTVEVLVTEIVERTVEVTRVVERSTEVTRVVHQDVPVTVIVTPTPRPATLTPKPPMPTPTPTPEPVDLNTTDRANAWVLLQDGSYGLDVFAEIFFDVGEFELDVLVDGEEYCNTTRIYSDDGPVQLGCKSIDRPHSSVERVSIQTPYGDLRCGKNFQSDVRETIFACVWR